MGRRQVGAGRWGMGRWGFRGEARVSSHMRPSSWTLGEGGCQLTPVDHVHPLNSAPPVSGPRSQDSDPSLAPTGTISTSNRCHSSLCACKADTPSGRQKAPPACVGPPCARGLLLVASSILATSLFGALPSQPSHLM